MLENNAFTLLGAVKTLSHFYPYPHSLLMLVVINKRHPMMQKFSFIHSLCAQQYSRTFRNSHKKKFFLLHKYNSWHALGLSISYRFMVNEKVRKLMTLDVNLNVEFLFEN